jgi:signal transduction histidine kinase
MNEARSSCIYRFLLYGIFSCILSLSEWKLIPFPTVEAFKLHQLGGDPRTSNRNILSRDGRLHPRKFFHSILNSFSQSDHVQVPDNARPIPSMPSELFQQLALSQLELLANSLKDPSSDEESKFKSKIKSMALYLPQENVISGQLEFLPAVIYPHPSTERVFIASEADSGVAPTLPKLLTKLPGFAAPSSLLPRYPMVSSASSADSAGEDLAGVGVVEEVLCDVQSGAAALSVPLFFGSQTVGVLLVSPAVQHKPPNKKSKGGNGPSAWTSDDREQIARAARTLSMALSMDMERSTLAMKNQRIQNALSDSLHQVKNPLQALRTFGKLLQRRVANAGETNGPEVGTTLQLLELTQNLMEQSDRVVNLLAPMDSLVGSLGNGGSNRFQKRAPLYLNPVRSDSQSSSQSLVPWGEANPPALPWEADTLDFARRENPNKTTTKSSLGSTSRHSESGGSSKTIEFSSRTASQSTKGENSVQPQIKSGSSPTAGPSSVSTASLVIGGDDDLEMGFVVDVLEPIFTAFKAIGEERGISFEIIGLNEADDLPGVLMRRKTLQEAVSNLLDNAFKYVVLSEGDDANPSPLVRLWLMANGYDQQLSAGVTILVEDNGPGIPLEEAESVFDRGFRSSSVSSLVQGTGIGLDISRSLLENMGGKLDCLVTESDRRKRFVDGNVELLNGAVFRLILFRNKN